MKGMIFNFYNLQTDEMELFLCLSEPVLSECKNITVLGIRESIDRVVSAVDCSYLYLLDSKVKNIPECFKNYMD